MRYPEANRSSLDAMSNTLLNSATGHTATLGSLATVTELPGQNEIRRENLQRDVTVTARLEGTDLGSAIKAVQKAVADLHLPPSIRVVYGGTYEEQQKSFRDLMLVLVLAIVLVFLVLLFEFRTLAAPLSILASALLSHLRRLPRPAHHPHHLQHRVVHGTDHGDRHRGQERHPAARRRPEISPRWTSRRTMP